MARAFKECPGAVRIARERVEVRRTIPRTSIQRAEEGHELYNKLAMDKRTREANQKEIRRGRKGARGASSEPLGIKKLRQK